MHDSNVTRCTTNMREQYLLSRCAPYLSLTKYMNNKNYMTTASSISYAQTQYSILLEQIIHQALSVTPISCFMEQNKAESMCQFSEDKLYVT